MLRCLFLILLLLPNFVRAEDVFRLPSFESIKAGWKPSDAWLLDRKGELIADLRFDPKVRRYPWVSLSSLPPVMSEALLAAEDKRFFDHPGVDWKAFVGAAWQNLWSSRVHRGASTITMQLAGLLASSLTIPGGGKQRRSVGQKWDQSLAALELEKRWTKAQILEAYLNLAPFRGDLEGIGAASEILFDLPASQISAREAVILSALLRGPNAKLPVVARRACALASLLKDVASCQSVTNVVQARLDLPRNQARVSLATALAKHHLRFAGQKVTTTLDANVQRALTTLLKAQSAQFGLVLDNSTGDVIAWASPAEGEDPLLQRNAWPLWNAPHWAVAALQSRQFTAASWLINPEPVLDAKDAWAGHKTRIMSLRTALVQHEGGALRNMVRELGASSEGFERLRELGAIEADGSLPKEVSPLHIAQAWRSFVTKSGFVLAPGFSQELPQAQRGIYALEAEFIAQDMLFDVPTSVKTSWQIHGLDGKSSLWLGSHEQYTLLLGGDVLSLSDRRRRSLLRENLVVFMKELRIDTKLEIIKPLIVPGGVLNTVVSFDPPTEVARREWFIRGTEFSPVMQDGLRRSSFIKWPVSGHVYALSEHPAPWLLQANTARAVRWFVDGQEIGSGAQVSWIPTTGAHTIKLFSVRDEVIDFFDFNVF